MKLLIQDFHALGDAAEDLIVMADIHNTHPDWHLNFHGFGEELFQGIPWIDPTVTAGYVDKIIDVSMDLIHNCNANGLHVVRCIEHDIAAKLNTTIEPGPLVCPIHFSDSEENETDDWLDTLDLPREGFWIVCAGGKDDFTCKHYPHEGFQKIIDMTKSKITWLQIGKSEHCHKALNNTINMLDKTKIRQLCRLIHRSSGVLTPISAPLHLSTMPWYHHNRPRPAVILGGGREPISFTLYPNHHWFSSVGLMDCCMSGGCWKGKINKDCKHPTVASDGQPIGTCMQLINPEEVAQKIINLDKFDKENKKCC